MKAAMPVFCVITLAVSACWAEAAERPADFGKRWVRSHPFTTMGLTIIDKISKTGEPFDFEQYKRQNYTVLLAWKPKEALYRDASKTGFPWLLNMSVKKPNALPVL